MSELQQHQDSIAAQADKLDREYDYLICQVDAICGNDSLHPDAAALATSQAKRVRSMAADLVRSIAQLRDYLQP